MYSIRSWSYRVVNTAEHYRSFNIIRATIVYFPFTGHRT